MRDEYLLLEANFTKKNALANLKLRRLLTMIGYVRTRSLIKLV